MALASIALIIIVAWALALWGTPEQRAKRRARDSAIQVRMLPELLGLADPIKMQGFENILVKRSSNEADMVYLTVEDSLEAGTRRGTKEEHRPADWISTFGAVSLSGDGIVTTLTTAEWQAIDGPAVPLDGFGRYAQMIRESEPLTARIAPALAAVTQTMFAPTVERKLICVLSVDGSIRKSSSLFGMGPTGTAVGECYIQVHRESDGHPVGPVFHLAGARNEGLALVGTWLFDGEWIIWHDSRHYEVWSIRHDWNKHLAELERQPQAGDSK